MTNERILQIVNAIRLSGAINMLDRVSFIQIAREIGADDVADWAEANRAAYSTLILTGRLDGEGADA
jgi:hypothetical protein